MSQETGRRAIEPRRMALPLTSEAETNTNRELVEARGYPVRLRAWCARSAGNGSLADRNRQGSSKGDVRKLRVHVLHPDLDSRQVGKFRAATQCPTGDCLVHGAGARHHGGGCGEVNIRDGRLSERGRDTGRCCAAAYIDQRLVGDETTKTHQGRKRSSRFAWWPCGYQW